ncbi:Dynein intermediate chain 3 [Blattella germanica]|nr:Dynein intermediate chain 3 [Blattella germanica]
MNHTEGGWPREVNQFDEEQTLRFRKKIEKDEMYIHTVLQLTHISKLLKKFKEAREDVDHDPKLGRPSEENMKKAMEHCILQNNAINIYEEYFEGIESASLIQHSTARTVNVYRDPNTSKRPVTHLSWSPDGGTRLAVTHCYLEFQRTPPDVSNTSFIWEVENPNKPQLALKPQVPIVCLEYNPKDPNSLVSGMHSGQVACWDVRRGSTPVDISVLEPRSSSLEYEGTIPTRFMVGTENGCVISCNRKGKTPGEKLVSKYTAHVGPVYAVQRNPAFVKNFLTVGDWMARICNHRAQLSDGAWSPTRPSVFFTTRMDGTLDVWDILQQQRDALIHVKVCDYQLRCLRVHDQGQLVAVGNNLGTSYLVEFSENLATTGRNDKMLLTAMLDRESRREKILEARSREIRLRQKTRMAESSHKELDKAKPSKPSQLVMDPAELEAMRAAAEAHAAGEEEEEEEQPPEVVEEPAPIEKHVTTADEMMDEIEGEEGEGDEDMEGDFLMDDLLGGDMGAAPEVTEGAAPEVTEGEQVDQPAADDDVNMLKMIKTR